MYDYDCAVLGGGPGGYVCAIRLGQLGKKTVLIEKGELGGECTNEGCIPSKHLISYASKLWHLRRMVDSGLASGNLTPNMEGHARKSREVIARLRQGIAFLLRSYGVKVLHGVADIPEPGVVEVVNGGRARYRVESIVVATGTEPASLPSLPIDGKRVIGYSKALFLESLPASMLVVGGGAVGLELGTAYAKLGVKVSVVEIMDQLLPGFDRDASRVLKRSLERMGVEIHLGTTVSAHRYVGDSLEVTLSNGARYQVDYILSAVGKRPTAWCKRLSEIGVEHDPKGYIRTDSQMRTSVEGIYAVGDVTGPPFLAHKASRQGIVAAESIAGLEARFDNKVIPYGVFTDPEVASIGMGEDEAKAMGGDIGVARFPLSSLGRAIAEGETEGFAKIIFERGSGEVRGLVVVGPHATEIVAEAALAIEAGVSLEDLARTIHIHPTYSESILEAAHIAVGAGIHHVVR
ncbi:Dihydrolipoyl dehydrogenase [archaeon HR01]|nr:Dihydrolipoyl dehydrogenase [archaeon HR01]